MCLELLGNPNTFLIVYENTTHAFKWHHLELQILWNMVISFGIFTKFSLWGKFYFFQFTFPIFHFYHNRWNYDIYLSSLFVNSCPLAWTSSNEDKLAIDLNQTSNSFTISEAETLNIEEKLDVRKFVFSYTHLTYRKNIFKV